MNEVSKHTPSHDGAEALQSSARILIVDDEPDAVLLLERILRSDGYLHLFGTTDAREVVSLFQEVKPDLVLLDLMMPHLDGFQLLAQLTALIPPETFVPLVVMTALTDATSKEQALGAGAHDFLTKPYLSSEVVLRIRNLLKLRELNLRLHQQNRDRAIFEAIVDSSHDAIISKTLQGIITSWNPGAEKLFGYRPAEAIGQPILMLFPPDRLDEEAVIMAQQMRGERIDNFETVRVGKDGQTIDVSLTVSPILDGQKSIIGISKIARDITQRKRTEVELAQLLASEQSARREAEEADRVKSELLSRMSHELRTPLNAILGFGQILEMRPLTPGDRESVEHILRAGRHLLGLVNEVLDITRIEAPESPLLLQQVALEEVVQEALAMVQPLAASTGVTLLRPEMFVSPLHVVADRQRLLQILLNLLANAIKYNKPEGHVRVSWDISPGGQARVQISDTGHGIATGDLPKLFVPFSRLNAERLGVEGTGLGLVLSQRLARAMEGSLHAQSQLGEGSTFSLELRLAPLPVTGPNAAPLTPAAVDHLDNTEKPRDVSPSTLALAPKTILLIEDNVSNFRLIEAILEDQKEVRLLGAMQGSLGVELACQHKPDLILLDVHLPDMMGDEVLRRLQSLPEIQPVPVIVLSADATPTQIDDFLSLGARQYLTKPLDVKQFLRSVIETLHLSPAGF